ncbi:hypothetical protein HPB50_010174 [Hyalomma asiaticum]|uniref:Uncharacterized protein n=1 Tax=Hyalomma asiaticum TaxID=266040 RepID=A0ACB7SXM4_HYAAI|nr:hypothetical protein HPB50_010174 [Hyalomma asiaticum]
MDMPLLGRVKRRIADRPADRAIWIDTGWPWRLDVGAAIFSASSLFFLAGLLPSALRGCRFAMLYGRSQRWLRHGQSSSFVIRGPTSGIMSREQHSNAFQDKVPAATNEDNIVDSGVDSPSKSRSRRSRRESKSRPRKKKSLKGSDSTAGSQIQRDETDTTLSRASSKASGSASSKSTESQYLTSPGASTNAARTNKEPAHDTPPTGSIIMVDDTRGKNESNRAPAQAGRLQGCSTGRPAAERQTKTVAAKPACLEATGTAAELLDPQRGPSAKDASRESVVLQRRPGATMKQTPGVSSVPPNSRGERPKSATELNVLGKADLQQSPQFDKVDHLIASFSGMHSQQRTQPLDCKPCVLCFASFIILLSVVFIVISLYRTDHSESVVCETDDCRLHAELITAEMDTALDPCNDFSARVCSAWEHRRRLLVAPEVIGLHPSVHADALAEWLANLKDTIDAGMQRVPTGDRARAMYDACMNHTDGSEIALLRSFMAELDILWPDPPATDVSPLGVLINLAYNYHTQLWFSIRLVSTKSVRVVVIGPGQHVMPASRHHARLTAVGGYENYWRTYYETFSSASRKDSKLSDAANAKARPSARMQSHVLAALSNATTNEGKQAAFRSRFKIGHFDELTTEVPASEWLSELNRHLRPREGLTLTDEVFANGIDVGSAIHIIFGQYARADILEQIGWLFADIYGPLADDRLLSQKFGDDNAAAARIALCATEVEKAFQPLVAALYVVSRFGTDARRALTEKLQAVVDMARLLTADALWMDNYTKALLRIKIHNASRGLWPPLIMLSQNGLSAIYRAFPSKWTTSFLDTWITVIKLSADLKHRNFGYNNLPSLVVGYQLPLFDYDYVSNNVLTSVAALTSPFYYTNGTKSMFYAGLGFFFAKELVRAIDDTGVTIDLTGREADMPKNTGDLSGNVSELWLTARAIASSHNRSRCLKPKHYSVFPEVPALQIAYAAYKAALTSLDDRERNLRVAHQYTEDQMFFLTVCYLMCSQLDKVEPLMGDCNKAVSSFPAFSAAFGCTDDAPMSASSRRCLYF